MPKAYAASGSCACRFSTKNLSSESAESEVPCFTAFAGELKNEKKTDSYFETFEVSGKKDLIDTD